MKDSPFYNMFPTWLHNTLLVLIIVILLTLIPVLSIMNFSLSSFDRVEFYTLVWQIVVGTSALILFGIKILKQKSDYLKLKVEIIERENYHVIRTEASNEINDNKRIYSAFLIVTPVNVDFIASINEKFQTNYNFSNSLSGLKFQNDRIEKDFALIHLPYYSEENLRVGNENLSFEIPYKSINRGHYRFYNIRFFVFRTKNDVNPYHRVVGVSAQLGNLKNRFIYLKTELNNQEGRKRRKSNIYKDY